jgi:four helix bundle protein
MTVWQESQELAVNIYKLTKKFPADEMYGLTSQIRRASSSVSANIAEGFGRASNKDKAHFYHIALGSLLETKNFIYLGAKLDYIEQNQTDDATSQIESIHKQITAILKYFYEKK